MCFYPKWTSRAIAKTPWKLTIVLPLTGSHLGVPVSSVWTFQLWSLWGFSASPWPFLHPGLEDTPSSSEHDEINSNISKNNNCVWDYISNICKNNNCVWNYIKWWSHRKWKYYACLYLCLLPTTKNCFYGVEASNVPFSECLPVETACYI